jgi:hypothetical protein
MSVKATRIAEAQRRAGVFLEGPAAVDALESYFSGRYTGAWFGSTGRPTDPSSGAPIDPSPNRFTIEDLQALSLLDVGLQPATMIEVLDLNIEVFPLLARIDLTLDLADAGDPRDESEGPWVAARLLWKLLRGVPGIGRTRASKLMARKRSHLIPVWDRHVADGLGLTKHDNDWVILQQVEDVHRGRLAELHTELRAAHPDDGVIKGLSMLRVLDVVVWMRTHGARESAPELLVSARR